MRDIIVRGAFEHNLKGLNVDIQRGSLTVVTGVSGSGKSSLAFDTILAESQRRFFYTLSHYSRQFLDLGSRPAVKSVTGLSPAIALAQNETMPSHRSTVGTLSDVSELLGVCFARFATKLCPKHHLSTERQSVSELAELILNDYSEQTVAICAPIAEMKKGNFATKLTRMLTHGFSKAYIDGEIVDLSPVPELAREDKHTIKIIIDVIKVAAKNKERIERALTTAFTHGEKHAEFYILKSPQQLDLKRGGSFSEQGGCAQCGFSWPALDSRYFSANSLGRCNTCEGYGTVKEFEDEEFSYEYEYDDANDLGQIDQANLRCKDCEGTGLNKRLNAIQIEGSSPLACQQMNLDELLALLNSWTSNNAAFKRVRQQISANLQRIIDVGLGYLQLNRRIRSLSGGELQRLKLAGILGDSLHGVLYVLDEPSQGLHPSEINRLCDMLDHLKKLGNTLIVVDHDETLMRRADWIIDLGPGGGARGGELMASFTPKTADKFQNQSLTARHLSRKAYQAPLKSGLGKTTEWIQMVAPSLHNLRMESVTFAKGHLNVVSGVSGSGKSSLVLATFAENAREYIKRSAAERRNYKFSFCKAIKGLDEFTAVQIIDRKPIGKSSVSMPATYLDVFGHLRTLYGKLPEAQIAGLDAAAFSLAREGGRCEACGGRGQVNLQMRFLADARVRCEVCQGNRYRPHVLSIKYNGFSLADVLNMTIDEAGQNFATHKKIQKLLQPAIDLGLGYLKLGQPSASLSGGEAQRLKLVPFLVKNYHQGSLVILDEPTTGLHFEDVNRLLNSLQNLVQNGATVIMIEHNIDVIRSADWLIDLGPGSAKDGGQVVYMGPVAGISTCENSLTREFLM